MMNGIERIRRLVANMPATAWRDALESVVMSTDVVEIAGYPRVDRAEFILAQAKSRLSNAGSRKLKTFGLENLIAKLESLPGDTRLENYGIKNSAYIGACFVLDGELIGCEFVARGTAKTIPFKG